MSLSNPVLTSFSSSASGISSSPDMRSPFFLIPRGPSMASASALSAVLRPTVVGSPSSFAINSSAARAKSLRRGAFFEFLLLSVAASIHFAVTSRTTSYTISGSLALISQTKRFNCSSEIGVSGEESGVRVSAPRGEGFPVGSAGDLSRFTWSTVPTAALRGRFCTQVQKEGTRACGAGWRRSPRPARRVMIGAQGLALLVFARMRITGDANC